MAWLGTYGASNQIIDEVRTDVEYLTWLDGLGNASYWERTVDQTRARYVGMTYAAAVTCQAAIHDPAGTPQVYASVQRESAAGAYMVAYTSITRGDWSVT